MVDWEVTATTIYCDKVDDEVTLIVSGNGAVKCTGRQKYENPKKEILKILGRKNKAMGTLLKCDGEDCAEVKQYRDKMLGAK